MYCRSDLAPIVSPVLKSERYRRSNRNWLIGIGLVTIVVLMVAVLGSLSGTDSANSPTPTRPLTVSQIKQLAVTMEPEVLERNTEEYTGQLVYLRQVRIFQVVEDDDNYILMVWMDSESEHSAIVNYQGSRLLEDDQIQLWARVRGRQTYETTFGASRTVPLLEALHIERR